MTETELVTIDSRLQDLANKILALKEKYGKSIIKDFLECKWNIGRELCVTRDTSDATYRTLERLTSIPFSELRRCVVFYEKYPEQNYELKAWRQHVAELPEIKDELPLVPLPSGVFDCIVIDPPWPYGTEYDAEGHRGASRYPELSLEILASMRIPASDSCVLWLWTTNAFMREAYALLDAWGFEAKTILTWVKDRMGVGTWLRGITEHCLLAVKGSPRIELTNQTTVLHAKRREHSRKPDEFYTLVEELCPTSQRRLDCFSREKRKGWSQYGNEPDKFSK